VLSQLLGEPLVGSTSDRSIALQAEQTPWLGNDTFNADILASGTGKALRLFTKAGKMGHGFGLIGYWNVRKNDGKVNDVVTCQDLYQLVGSADVDRSFILNSYRNKGNYAVRIPAHAGPNDIQMPVMQIGLDAFQFDIISVSPVDVESGIAILGLFDKYNRFAGVKSTSTGCDANSRRYCKVELKCCGTLVVFVQKRERNIGEEPVVILNQNGSGTEEIRLPCKRTILGDMGGDLITVNLDRSLPSLSVIVYL